MGLGGDLTWTPVFRELYRQHGRKVRVVQRPRFTDLVRGRDYYAAVSLRQSPVFETNPILVFNTPLSRSGFQQKLDTAFELFLDATKCRGLFMRWLYKKERRQAGPFVMTDLPQHSWVVQDHGDHYVWKSGRHVIDWLADSVGLPGAPHQCEMYYTQEDEQRVAMLIGQMGLQQFIAIEPCTNTEYFGDIRAWPFDRWQKVCDCIRAEYSSLQIVQVGTKGAPVLKNTLSACGELSFRQTALLLKKSRLFLGTEGGLMHAANAVTCPAVIIWSGLTPPELATYPETQSVIRHPVSCAPCGLRVPCPRGHICMMEISEQEVMKAIRTRL